mmetsp:Transcript_9285/g.15627  ORF Transcript_9285/g.15627 Transcript_9285/m.15627 type:complete len:224 (+) Transcript_9285:111-782(+)
MEEEQSDFMGQYTRQMRSYDIAFWPECDGISLPFELNQKKLIKLGFECIGDCQIQCVLCRQSALVPDDLKLENTLLVRNLFAHLPYKESQAKQREHGESSLARFVARLRDATHLYECPYNKSNSLNQADFFKVQMASQPRAYDLSSPLAINDLGLYSSKILYVRAQEILASLVGTYTEELKARLSPAVFDPSLNHSLLRLLLPSQAETKVTLTAILKQLKTFI